MAKYRKKPVVIDAVRVTKRQVILTREGRLYAYPGDWLITGVEGEKYPCGNKIFRTTYEYTDFKSKQMWDRPETDFVENQPQVRIDGKETR